MKREHYLLVGLVIIVFIVMSPVLQNQFIDWDDEVYITKNEVVKEKPFTNLREIFTYKINNFAVPLTLLSFQIEYYFFGLNPKPYHVNNLILHLLNVLLVYFFIKNLINQSLKSGILEIEKNKARHSSIWKLQTINYQPFIVALLFGIHPMNVESVAWATERKDLLYTFFALLSLVFYTRSTTHKKQETRSYIVCLFFFLLSLLSKPQAIFFPLLLLLIDYFQRGSLQEVLNPKKQVKKIPFFVLSLLAGSYLLINVGTKVAALSIDYPFFDKILFSSYQMGLYLWKLFFPFSLNNFYSYPQKIDGLYPIIFYVSPLLIVGLFGFIFWKFHNDKLVMFGTLFYLFNIFIFLQIFSVNTAIAYERFNYMAYLGLFLIGVSYFSQIKRASILIICIAYLLMLSYLSFERCKVWTNDVTFFADMAKKNPQDITANKVVLKNEGDALIQKNLFPEAIEKYNQSLAKDPNYEQGYLGRAFAYFNMKLYQEAIYDYTKVMSLEIDTQTKVQALFNRGICFLNLRAYPQAIQDFSSLIQAGANPVSSLINRAYCWLSMGEYEKARTDYQSVLQIDNNNATAIQQLQYIQSIKK